MGLGKTDLCDDRGGNEVSVVASMVSCSICLDAVTDNGDRSTAKLQCGHEFHLDCIGSAFNAKGLMQCPNCRKIEKGQWLYANGYRSYPEFSMDDWTHDEDLYDLSYSEMPIGVHWCPFSGLTRLPSSFEEGESPSTAYHDIFGGHPLFGEHAAPASSAAHSCPFVGYFQPHQPSSSSNPAESASDGPPFHLQWGSVTGPGDIPTSHAFPSLDIHYQGWEYHSRSFSPPNSRSNGADQASVSSTTLRPTRPESDGLPRTGSFVHPFLFTHGSPSRGSSSVLSSSILAPYQGNGRGHPRVQNLRAYPQQAGSSGIRPPPPVLSGARRSSGPRGVVSSAGAPSSSDHSGYYVLPPPSGSSGRSIQETGGNRFYAWERDRFAPYPLVPVDRESSWWGPFHQGASGSDSGSRNGFWHRHASERSSSQARTENPSYQPIHLSQMHPYL